MPSGPKVVVPFTFKVYGKTQVVPSGPKVVVPFTFKVYRKTQVVPSGPKVVFPFTFKVYRKTQVVPSGPKVVVPFTFKVVTFPGLEEGQPRECEDAILLGRLPVCQPDDPDARVGQVGLPRLQDGLHPVARLAVLCV